MKKTKYRVLRNSVILDLIGVGTSFIPFIDLIWAPFAAKKMMDMYDGDKGKIAAWIVFIEEILPGTDFIPTFTLMWIYTYVISSEKQKMQPIEVEINE